jgi:IclR family KDG regulon transcriptional repressor
LRRIQSIDRTLNIVEALANAKEPVGLSELARHLGLHVSTLYGLISTLVARGYVEQDKDTNRYQLGYKFYQMGRLYINNNDLHGLGKR